MIVPAMVHAAFMGIGSYNMIDTKQLVEFFTKLSQEEVVIVSTSYNQEFTNLTLELMYKNHNTRFYNVTQDDIAASGDGEVLATDARNPNGIEILTTITQEDIDNNGGGEGMALKLLTEDLK